MNARLRSCLAKNRYASKKLAHKAVAARTLKGGQKLSVYRCPACEGWHLTKGKT